ncbi:MAG: TIGR02300 family protein [Sphingomonas sp.]
MVKPEWGTKRTCPKCATRFYDLGKEDPVTCIECGTTWTPEPILKSKQPVAFDQSTPAETKKKDAALAGNDDDHEDDDLNIDEDEEASPDDEVDLGDDDDDIGGVKRGDEDEEN